jgi:O-antigen ligase
VTIARPHPAAPTLREPSSEAVREPPDATAARRPRALELGIALLVVAVPLVFLPMSDSPFVDVKLALALVAVLCLWLGGTRVDRTLAIVVWAWVGSMALSMVTGVDPWISLAGVDSNAGGLVLLGASGYALVAGAALPRSLVDRIPGWLFAATVPVSVVAIVWRFAPDTLLVLGRSMTYEGSTLGHPVFLSGLTAAAVGAAVGVRMRHRAWFVTALILIASALSLSAKRSGLIAVVVGLVVALVRARAGKVRSLLIVGVVVGTLSAWSVASSFVPAEQALSGVQRFEQLDSDSAAARVHITKALTRAWADRPILGWGVGNTWTAYLKHATLDDVEVAHRGIADAHNLLLGTAASTGTVGLIALVALIGVVVRRAWKGPRQLGWAAGAAAALFVTHLLQPVHTSLTPLMFLLAGIAAGTPGPARAARTPARVGRAAVGVLLSAGLLLSTLVLASSVLDRWGRTYNSVWSLRTAMSLAPGRLWPVQALAVYRGQDAAAGDEDAEREVRELIDRALDRHPLNPDSRMIAVQAGLMMNDPEYARMWLQRQMEVFPGDLASLNPAGLEFLRTGRLPGYEDVAQSALSDADTAEE